MYLALYRKYRPRTFDDVISQEHITTTLKNQITNGSAGHAYLFTGSRGTGKTTCAKILAMAVNCEHPENGSPCMKCDRCKEILDGSTPDVVEMDAASNRGVEDVRRLREEVAYTPVSCKYRVYIIDEVHMLTTEAFNALLKTLEEPPPHVKFILATTELHKVPATISSRCQRFEFRRVDVNDSAKRLAMVAEKEGFTLDGDAGVLISRLSDGGMRDALSVLDRCASCDNHITVNVVRECAGIADNHHLYRFSEMIAQRNTPGCIRLLGELHNQSKDIALIINNLIEHYRDLMIYKSAPAESDLLFALPDELERVSSIAGMYSMNEVLDCLSFLSECAENIGRSKQRKTLAEMCFVKMCARGGSAPAVQFAQSAQPVQQKPVTAPPPAPVSVQTAPPPVNVAPAPPPPPTAEVRMDEPPMMQEPPRLVEDDLPFDIDPVPEQVAPPEQSAPPERVAPPEPMYEPVPQEPPFLADDDYPIKSDIEEPTNADLKPFTPISREQWEDALPKLGFLMSSMLSDAEIRCTENTLIITSSNQMLLENVKDDELENLRRNLSSVLGMKLFVRIEESNAVFDEEQDSSAVEQLLKKAQGLGISIKIKE